MLEELEKLIKKFIESNGAEGGGGIYFIGFGAKEGVDAKTQFTELTEEICKFYNLDYSEQLRKHIQEDFCDGDRFHTESIWWIAKEIHKKIIEINLNPDNEHRGVASIMDTGLFDFVTK